MEGSFYNRPLGIKVLTFVNGLLAIGLTGRSFKLLKNSFSDLIQLIGGCSICALLHSVCDAVIILCVVLLSKTAFQIAHLNVKGKDNQINLSVAGIFILIGSYFSPVRIRLDSSAFFPLPPVICGILIMYFVWAIIYLNTPKVKELFE